MSIIGIYKITNNINGKVYIGESLNIEERWNIHKNELKENKHHSYKLQNDYNIYGVDNFTYEIIETLNNDYTPFLNQMILLVYEHKYIKIYNSLECGYNVEDTLFKILNKEKAIFDNAKMLKDVNIKILKSIIKNINNNNGKYVPNEKKINSKKEKTKKLKKEYIKKEKPNKPKKEYIKKEYVRNSIIVDISLPELTFREYIFYIQNIGYKLNYSYNDIFKYLRDNDIFYYDENKNNTPKNEYLNYFSVKIHFDNSTNKTYHTIMVLKNGYSFLENYLLSNNIISL